MTDAREIIAKSLFDLDVLTLDASRNYAASFLSDLADAGIRLAGPDDRILGPDEVAALQRALTKAEDGAGTLPAKQSVKLRPADWHALGTLVRALGLK